MGERKYNTIQQHEPLRIPSMWSHQERRFVAQLEEILDDMYRRFNRIKLSDLGSELKETVVSSADSVENMETQVNQANEQIKAVSDQQSDLTERLSSTESKTEEAIARIDQTYDHILQQVLQNGEVMTEINQTVDGIDAWSKDTEGNLAELLLTANGIKAQVNDVEGNVGRLLLDSDEFRVTLQNGDTVLSEIEQLQDQINLKVNDANGTIGALTVKADSITGKITSADNRISQLVVKTDGLTYTLEQNSETLALFDVNQQHMLTQIGSATSSIGNLEVTANAITQKVEDVSKGVAQIKVQADNIELTVKGKVDGKDIASTINQTAQSVLIQASKIDLQGYVKMEDFEAVTGWTESFTGHSISADYITCGTGDFDNLVFGTLAGENCGWSSKSFLTSAKLIKATKTISYMTPNGDTASVTVLTSADLNTNAGSIAYLAKN